MQAHPITGPLQSRAGFVEMDPVEAEHVSAALGVAIDTLAADPLTASEARVLREFKAAHDKAHGL